LECRQAGLITLRLEKEIRKKLSDRLGREISVLVITPSRVLVVFEEKLEVLALIGSVVSKLKSFGVECTQRRLGVEVFSFLRAPS